MADQAQLDRDAARHRPALLGKPHARYGFGQAQTRARPGDELHRIQLHDLASLRFRGAEPALRLPIANGRFGPVGEHRQRHRPWPTDGHPPIARPDNPTDYDVFGRKDGQDCKRSGLAQCRHEEPLRILAVLAQHRRRGRGTLFETVHDTAAGGDRTAGKTPGSRDQRSQEGSCRLRDDITSRG